MRGYYFLFRDNTNGDGSILWLWCQHHKKTVVHLWCQTLFLGETHKREETPHFLLFAR
jgi:hypothetical protein